MLSECDHPPFNRHRAFVRINATVIDVNGARVKLSGRFPSRKPMDAVIDLLYPQAQLVSIIVKREAYQ